MSAVRMACAACLAAAAVAALSGQQPVFRSGVDLVTVDVTVLGRNGAPLEGLSADRFDVTVDGSPRRVVWAEFVRHRPAPLATARASDHFATNEDAQPGRIVLIAVDQMHIRRVEGLPALRAAAAFVDALDAADRVAATRLNDAAPIDFTTDHVSVKRRLQRLTGEVSPMPMHYQIGVTESLAIADGSRTILDLVVRRECGQPLGRFENLGRLAEGNGMRDPCPAEVEQEGRAMAQLARTDARLTLDALGRLIVRLAEIDGPKTLVLLSEGLIAEPQLIDLTSLGAAAQAARVTLHVLQLETPTLDAASDKVSPTLYADMQARADGLSRLAGAARGGLFRLVGSDPYPFKRIVTELSAHYLVAFEPDAADRDGRTHRIELRVRADGAQVRARPAFRIPAGAPASAVDADLVRLLRNPRLATELPVRVAAYTFRDASGDRLHVLISAEIDRAPGNPELTAGFVLVDAKGVIAASGGGVTDGGRFLQNASVPAGKYILKAAAIDPGGRKGSVERQLDVRLTEVNGIQLSDLMIADPPLSRDGTLRPLVIRANGDRAVAYVEAYNARDGGVAATLDIARDGGRLEQRVPTRITMPAAGRASIAAEIPVRDLDPGAYTATMRVTLQGAAEQILTRRFVVVK
jgi:VWFA-related protein